MRLIAVSVALVSMFVIALTVIKVPATATGGYQMSDSGQYLLVTSTPVPEHLIHAGARVDLYRAGLIGRELIGSAVLAGQPGQETLVPIETVMPVADLGLKTQGWTYPLIARQAPPQDLGAATLVGPELPLWQWVVDSYLVPVLPW